MSSRKKLLGFRCCEFVIISNSKVCRGMYALAVRYDFGNAFLLGDSMYGPICLGRTLKNANNMPELLVHFRFLYKNDTAKIQTKMRGW
jgi:hypothetical protein